MNEKGVQITSNRQTSTGIFVPNTPAADLSGSGKFSDFVFHIDSSDMSHGNLASGTATFMGDRADMLNVLQNAGAFHYPFENDLGSKHPTHPNSLNFRFSTGRFPSLFDYGASPHFVVPMNPQATVPGPGTKSDFHVDSRTGVSHGECAYFGKGC